MELLSGAVDVSTLSSRQRDLLARLTTLAQRGKGRRRFVYIGSLPQIEVVDPLEGDPTLVASGADLEAMRRAGLIRVLERPNSMDFDFELSERALP